MFNIGWPEMVILVFAALMILGPERLPEAIRWTARSMRQVREYATGATNQLRGELGTDLDEIRKPLEELQQLAKPLQELRGMTPRGLVTKHLLNGDDSLFTGQFDGKSDKPTAPAHPPGEGNPNPPAAWTPPEPPQPLARNEEPPIDFDAT